MNRFDWLEMPSAEEQAPLPPWEQVQPRWDEKYYMGEADRCWKRGDYEKALRSYSKALGMDPNLEEGWVGQLRCLLDMDEVKEARVWCNKALERLPRSAQILGVKSMILSRMAEHPEAMELSDKAFSMKQYTWGLWYSRGYVLLRRRLKNAEHCFQKALEFNPQDGAIALRIGMAYLEAKEYHQAYAYLRKAFQGDPTNPLVLLKYGQSCVGLGWTGQALAHYRKAMDQKTELQKEIWAAQGAAEKVSPLRWINGLFHRFLLKEA